uniref:Uncharacterized protein n=1 Tax=Arundo donax TaxID=35708 RepID=A0A0A9GWF6_ARUDO
MPQFPAESQEPTRTVHNRRSSERGAAHLPATTRTLHVDGKPSAPPQTSGPSAPLLTLLVSQAFRDLQPVRSSPSCHGSLDLLNPPRRRRRPPPSTATVGTATLGPPSSSNDW